jgi:hypothetical protein
MATVHLKSDTVTNSDATPRVLNNSSVEGGFARRAVGVVVGSASDSIGSTYRYVRVPSNAVIKTVKYWCPATGATGQVDIGVYQTAENGGAVVDADLFASAVDPGGGAIAAQDVTHESGEYTFAESLLPLWKVLGLSADPGRYYDIAATVVEEVANAVTSKLDVEYLI